MSEKRLDCILIPGGGLLPTGELPPWTKARLLRALEIQEETTWIGLLSGGTVHKPPPRDQAGYPLFESRQAAEFLIDQGTAPHKLWTEICSYDTIGNAYFSRLLFAAPFQLKKLHIITSSFHIDRTKAIFSWVYSLAPREADYQLSFESTPDLGLSEEARQARILRERSSLSALRSTIHAISTLELFHRWLYSEHAAYGLGKDIRPLAAEELKSY